MRADSLNSHGYPVRTEMTGTKQVPVSQVFSMEESELEKFLFGKTLLQICSTDEDESKVIIVDERST